MVARNSPLSAPSHANVAWAEIEPTLDKAMSSLGESDRSILIMHFWENRSPADLAVAFGVSDDAAKKRLFRATDRLRKLLSRTSPAMSVTALVPLLASHAITEAPADLANKIASAAFKSSIAAGGVGVTTKGALTLMTALNAKSVTVAAIAILALGGAIYATKQFITPESATVPLSSTTSLPPSAATTEAVGGTNDWQARFNSVYNLKPGEVVKRIEPPYISERRAYFTASARESGSNAENSEDYWITFSWDGKLHRQIMSSSKGTVGTALLDGLEIKPYQIESDIDPWATPLPGDLIVLKAATPDQRIKAFAPIISAETKNPVHFELKHLTKNAIVLRGTYRAPKLSNGKDDSINIFPGSTPPITRMRNKHYGGSVSALCDGLELQTRLQVIDQTSPRFRGSVIFTTDGVDPKIAQHPAELQSLLDNLARQTSLQITLEPRETDVWTWVNG